MDKGKDRSDSPAKGEKSSLAKIAPYLQKILRDKTEIHKPKK
jgi:hypothetical protein